MRGKVIAITGASGNLGPSVVAAFVDAGATVALIDRDLAKLERVLASTGASVEAHLCSQVDLLDPAQTEAWARDILARFGRIDGALHLVGGYRGGQKIAEFAAADWQLLKALLIETTWNVVRAFAELLRAHGGRFVLVSSPQAARPSHANAAYGACKAASEALALALADSFKGSAATSNIVVVNAILTPQMRAEKPNDDYSKFTSTEDIAAAMLYLCSDAAAAMNGQRLALHGRA